jgi:hypothetical protein
VGRIDDEEDIGSYWITLRKGEYDSHLKEEALDRTMWRAGFGPVVRQTAKWIDSSVGIATRYGLDGPGIESRSSDIFCTSPDRPWVPPSLL